MRFGVPFSEVDTVFFGGGLERTKIKPGTNIPAAYLDLCRQLWLHQHVGAVDHRLVARRAATARWRPTKGRYQRVNGEWGVAGDARYVRANYQFQQYIPLNKQFTLAFNAELGWGKGLNGRPFPVFKNFYSRRSGFGARL